MNKVNQPCRFEGVYRCIRGVHTCSSEADKFIDPCDCGGGWLYYPRDNCHDSEAKRVYLNGAEMIEVVEVPKVGQQINLVGVGIGQYDGTYLVTDVGGQMCGVAGTHPRIRLMRMRDINPDLLTFAVSAARV